MAQAELPGDLHVHICISGRKTLELAIREGGRMAGNSIAQPREMHAGLEV